MLQKIKGLDTLRAFAVIFVIIAHWGPVYYKYEPVGYFISKILVPDGATGVYIFFTLSGFLITSILLNARLTSKDTNRFLIIKNFLVRRALRIFPIYYIFLFAITSFLDLPDVNQNISWYLTYTSNFLVCRNNLWNSASHTWTLAIEEQFYLFWPWVILFINEKYLKYVFLAAIIIGSITTYFILKVKMEPFMVYNCFDAFGVGGFYAYARLNATTTEKFEKTIKKLAPFLLVVYFFWKVEWYYFHNLPLIFLKKTVESLLTIWLIALIINNKSVIVRKSLLENKVLNFIGRISYCIYLIHPYIYRFNGQYKEFINRILINRPGWIAFLTSNVFIYCYNLSTLILLCWLSYVLIEKPILSLKKYFNYKSNPIEVQNK